MLHNQGYLTGAEKKVCRSEFADLGNSPIEYAQDIVENKEIVLATSNGTKAIKAAQDCNLLLIGAFVNLKAVAHRCVYENKDVLIVCSGWKDRICVEDSLFAGALTSCLLENEEFKAASDGTRIAVSLWHHANKDFNKYMMKSEHAQRLMAHGFEEDLNYCLKQSIFQEVPELRDGKLIVDRQKTAKVQELEEAEV